MDRYTTLKSILGETTTPPKYPSIPFQYSDFYVTTTIGDRFDILSQQYYNDSELWWIISIANPQLPQGSYYPPVGVQLRIPRDVAGIIQQYKDINNR